MSTPARRSLSDARADLLQRWQAQPDPSPFTHPDVCAAAAEAFGLATTVWMNDHASAVAFEKRVGVGLLSALALALPPVVPVSAPILTPAPSEADNHHGDTDLDALIQALSATYAQATFALPSSWRDPRPFAWAGWTAESRFTYTVQLPSDTDTWSSGRRQTLRSHAETFDVRVDADPPEIAAEFQSEAYQRKGIAFDPSVAQMSQIASAMQEAGCLRTVVAWQDEAARAAAVFAVAGTRATYWLAGSEPGPAMTVLFANAFEALAAEGVTEIDLGGANVRSVAEFKRQFGARLAPVFRVRHVGPRWLRELHAIRQSR
ncbi:MAG: GNAT family N-acetyltransferase [Bacteroidota bacterium]